MQHENNPSFYVRVSARVLGCLLPGEITVILFPGHGLVLIEAIPTYLIPENLRMPNSEFYVLFKHPGREMIRILQIDEFCPEIDGSQD
ncbi:hypothetical protein [Nostoc sp. PCC 7107]|uniref:hypothetical protein n=1 Tax=Nostoc sp. PCC 7107 TaxID=317936 RepID=UPI00029F296A|nr:hypothetical protein [Nostoc sp. PCC 7107]AFY43219.1 hypothetical protein Nos7107_2618 [Nostoc sp. PCC 7107]